MRQFFLCGLVLAVSILAAPASASSEPRPAPSPGLCENAIRSIDAAAAATLRQGSPGMIVEVARYGDVLFSGTYGYGDLEQRSPVTQDTVFKYASITKAFTAAAVLSLAEDGLLDIEDPLARHVPELAAAANVRIYDLLVQTSGIPDFAEDPSGLATKSVAKTPEDMLAWIVALTPELDFEPGARWAYSNSNYVLLGLIAERVSGRPLPVLFEERLFAPAGLTATAFDDPGDVVSNRAEGYRRAREAPSGFRNADWISPTIPGPAGGLRGTASDLVRWNDALFGGRILDAHSLALMIAPGLLSDGRTTKFGMLPAWQEGLNSDYAMGLFVKATPGGARLGHSGDIDGFSTWVAHYPENAITIVQMINSQSADLDIDGVEAAVFPAEGQVCLRE